jgi:hypothetical protein
MIPAFMISGLVEAALRSLLVAVAVWGGLRLFRVSNVLAQKAVWVLMLAAAAVTPALMHRRVLPFEAKIRVPVHAWNAAARAAFKKVALAVKAPASAAVVVPQYFAALEQPALPADRVRVPMVSHAEFTASDPARPSELKTDSVEARRPSMLQTLVVTGRGLKARGLLECVYFAVLGCLLLRMLVGLAAAAKIWLNAEQIAEDQFAALDVEAARGLRVRSSAEVLSPVTIGSGVVLPDGYASWDVEKLRIVLAHEGSHVRQGDFYLQLMAALYAAAFWFSPLGWWLKRKLSDLGEAISDHAGLEEAASSTSYARVLLEFAAMPRPTATGVAMARTSNLSHRIERLLNESKFRSAFAGSGRRVLLASLLVPVALFAGTALIRVEAAQAAPAASQVQAPAEANATAEASEAIAPAVPPAAAAAVIVAPVAQVAPVAAVAPAGSYGEVHDAADDLAAARANVNVNQSQDEPASGSSSTSEHSYSTDKYENGNHVYGRSTGKGYTYSYSSDGESWALITDATGKVSFSGDWNSMTRSTIDKARKVAKGKFLWFTHDGKSYFVDDPATIAQIEELYKPMEDLGRRQEELGKQQEALGRQQEALGHKQEQASVPTPDVTREMAKLNEMAAKLEAKKGGTVSQEELADLEGKLGDLQGKLGELQGRIGEQQGKFGDEQGKLGEQQGKLGEQQGKLGEEQGKIAEQADRKVKSTIDESLKDGKAKPVE